MKKYVILSLLAMGLSVPSFAGVSTQVNTKGGEANPQYAGVSVCQVGTSTGTNDVLCTTGSGVILDIIVSSVNATNYITIRDTSIANHSSAELFRVSPGFLGTAHIYPRFSKGLNVTDSATDLGAAGTWNIIYTKDLN